MDLKLLTEDGVWQTLLQRKYIGSKTLSSVVWKPGDSHFLAGLMATKKFSSAMVLSLFMMDHRYGFGRTTGLIMPRSRTSSLFCIISFVIKVISLARFNRA
jgi:hypothetical protein